MADYLSVQDDDVSEERHREELGEGSIQTKTRVKRLIFFRGHARQVNSALITQVFDHYHTFSSLVEGNGEFATRTLSNLYNLHAIRGSLNSDGKLSLESSMSGPHAYYGYISPFRAHSVQLKNDTHHPVYLQYPITSVTRRALQPVPDNFITQVEEWNWLSGGSQKSQEILERYHIDLSERREETFLATTTSQSPAMANSPTRDSDVQEEKLLTVADGACGSFSVQPQDDSLFKDPGVLELNGSEMELRVLKDPHLYDLSSFLVEVVPNNVPFSFDQSLVRKYSHAQHKLRVVTYCYGPRYVPDYLMKGNGLFLERHEFIQAITPLHETASGAVIVGREVSAAASNHGKGNCEKPMLDLLALEIPYGCTLVVNACALHGDSTLTGMYSMAMTGNHHAMATADTVFLKDRNTRQNVRVNFYSEEEEEGEEGEKSGRVLLDYSQESRFRIETMPAPIRPVLSCDKWGNEDIAIIANEYKELCRIHVANTESSSSSSSSLLSLLSNTVKSATFTPVMYMPSRWKKSLGTKIPV